MSDDGKLMAFVSLLATDIKMGKSPYLAVPMKITTSDILERIRNATLNPIFARDIAMRLIPSISDILNYPVSCFRHREAKLMLLQSGLSPEQEKYWTEVLIRNAAHVQFKVRANVYWYGALWYLIDQIGIPLKDLRRMLSGTTVDWTANGDLRIQPHCLLTKIILVTFAAYIGVLGCNDIVQIFLAKNPNDIGFLSISFIFFYVPVFYVLWFLGPFSWRSGRTLSAALKKRHHKSE